MRGCEDTGRSTTQTPSQPFCGKGNVYSYTPDDHRVGIRRSPTNPFAPVGCGHQKLPQAPWEAVNAVQRYGRTVSFEIGRRKNETLRIFTGGAESFKMWHDRMGDHISQNNPRWRTILLWLGTEVRPVKKAECLTYSCLSVNS